MVTPEVTPDPMAESTGDMTPKGLPPLGGPYAVKLQYNCRGNEDRKKRYWVKVWRVGLGMTLKL